MCVRNYIKKYSSLETLLQELVAPPTEEELMFLSGWENIVLLLQNQLQIILHHR